MQPQWQQQHKNRSLRFLNASAQSVQELTEAREGELVVVCLVEHTPALGGQWSPRKMSPWKMIDKP